MKISFQQNTLENMHKWQPFCLVICVLISTVTISNHAVVLLSRVRYFCPIYMQRQFPSRTCEWGFEELRYCAECVGLRCGVPMHEVRGLLLRCLVHCIWELGLCCWSGHIAMVCRWYRQLWCFENIPAVLIDRGVNTGTTIHGRISRKINGAGLVIFRIKFAGNVCSGVLETWCVVSWCVVRLALSGFMNEWHGHCCDYVALENLGEADGKLH